MKSVFIVELKRAFCNKMFLLVLIFGGVLAILAFTCSGDLEVAKYWYDFVSGKEGAKVLDVDKTRMALQLWMPNAGYSNKFYYLLVTITPILAAIPYGTSYVLDKKNGLINQFAIRCKKKYYYISKMLVAFISGGTVAVIPLLINLIVCMCALPWGKPVYSFNYYLVTKDAVFASLFYEFPELYVFIYILFDFIVFGLLNCICLSFVYIEDNIFALVLSPFIFYYVVSAICKYLPTESNCSLLSNMDMMMLYNKEVIPILIQVGILLILAVSFLIRIKKDVI